MILDVIRLIDIVDDYFTYVDAGTSISMRYFAMLHIAFNCYYDQINFSLSLTSVFIFLQTASIHQIVSLKRSY